MRSFLKYLVFCFAIVSCSSDGSSDPTPDPVESYFVKLTFDGVVVMDGINYSYNNALRMANKADDFYKLEAITLTEGPHIIQRNIQITFDKYGNLASVSAIKTDTDTPTVVKRYYNYPYASGTYFNFELESLDEVNHTVKGNFSGKLYADRFDLNSEFIEISGSFYTQINSDHDISGSTFPLNTPNVYAKFNGVDWHSSRSLKEFRFTSGFGWNLEPEIERHISDDDYKLVFMYQYNVSLGTYQFSDTNGSVYVKLGVFNHQTHQFDYYNSTSGEININENFTNPYVFNQSGTFSLTAVNPANPADIIQITDGAYVFER